MKTSRILVVVVVILLAVAALWGVITYGLEYLASPRTGGSPVAADAWGTLIILTIGLLAGYVSGRYLMTKHEPPGDIWMVLTAGVGGAWLGGALPSPACWRWQDVNVPGSIVLAFVLAAGARWLSAHWRGKGGDR